MAIEHARAHVLLKPWGVADLRPWSNARHDGGSIGEIWYERPARAATYPSLLLKLLFTSQPLSIQVHPDDAFAHSMGLPRGKSEAWYILSAAPEAKVALGLKQRMTPQQLHEAVDDGRSAGVRQPDPPGQRARRAILRQDILCGERDHSSLPLLFVT